MCGLARLPYLLIYVCFVALNRFIVTTSKLADLSSASTKPDKKGIVILGCDRAYQGLLKPVCCLILIFPCDLRSFSLSVYRHSLRIGHFYQ